MDLCLILIFTILFLFLSWKFIGILVKTLQESDKKRLEFKSNLEALKELSEKIKEGNK